jgi:hypothetical protein
MNPRKYIFMTGAPGSKWSSVARTIYWSNDINHSDYSEERKYVASTNNRFASHIGAYWDPGMEFSPDNWDGPFSGEGVRLVKSHTFAHSLNELKNYGHPIVMVYSNDYECMNQWFTMGGFGITYPNYKPYYKNSGTMWNEIIRQNRDIMDFIQFNRERITRVKNNFELCDVLDITQNGLDPKEHGCDVDGEFSYGEKDIAVYVYR